MKGKMVLKWMNRIVSTILLVLLIGVAGLVVSTKLAGGEPQIFGYQIKTVLSGSMEPSIQTGSLIAVKTLDSDEKENLKADDVITFMETQDKLVTHRIIDVKQTAETVLYTTQGDNNNGPDREPVLAENVVASYQGFTIPYLGYIASFAQSPNGSLVFFVLPGLLMVGYSFFSIMMAIRKMDVNQNNKPADTN